jgi:hypothetical protein
MMNFRKLVVSAGFAAALAVPTSSWALVFNGNFFFTGSAFSEPGLRVKSTATGAGNANPFSFAIEDGQMKKFKIAKLWTDETWVNADDKVPQDIALNVNITSPFADSGRVEGTTKGKSIAFGLLQWGKLKWDDPLTFKDDEFGTLTVALSGGKFNKGLFGLCPGECKGLNVHAKVSYHGQPAPVPLPASLVLLLSAVGAIGLFGRRAGNNPSLQSDPVA